MAFGSPLRSTSTDYLRSVEMDFLQREAANCLTEILSVNDGRIGALRSLTSLSGLGQNEMAEAVRRHNLIITLVNNRVNTSMLYAEVHPKFDEYGQLPREFGRGRRLEEFLNMEVITIDRILQQYNLPRDRRPEYLLSNSLLNRDRLGGDRIGTLGLSIDRCDRLSDRIGTLGLGGDRLGDRYGLNREAKLLVLFEWLGVDLSNERLGGLSGRFGLEADLRRLSGEGALGSGTLGGSSGGLLGGGRGLLNRDLGR